MNSIYRLRPYNENTLRELSNPHLWFSKPSAFKDVEDANVQLMIENNEILQKVFSIVLNEHGLEELKRLMTHVGICCFTTEIPSIDDRTNYPQGKGSLCIEYDKEKLADFFLNVKGLPNCFKEVIYTDSLIKVENDGGYHILMHKDENGEQYDSILQMQYDDPNRFMEKLLFFLLTRINEKFKRQKEIRIVWAGFRIVESEDLGYHVGIPKECIKCIYVYPDTPTEYTEAVKKIGYNVIKIDKQ